MAQSFSACKAGQTKSKVPGKAQRMVCRHLESGTKSILGHCPANENFHATEAGGKTAMARACCPNNAGRARNRGMLISDKDR
jgi:hypothetical protein